MIVVIDADYDEQNHKGHVAGIICDYTTDDLAKSTVTAVVDNIAEYCPGEFYRRELQCVDAILKQLDLKNIELIIVDGYADFGTEHKSLGTYVFEKYHMAVIGIAKNHYDGCLLKNTEVTRGDSLKPLFVTAKGISAETAKEIVRNMVGEYRIPVLIKLADQAARDWSL